MHALPPSYTYISFLLSLPPTHTYITFLLSLPLFPSHLTLPLTFSPPPLIPLPLPYQASSLPHSRSILSPDEHEMLLTGLCYAALRPATR